MQIESLRESSSKCCWKTKRLFVWFNTSLQNKMSLKPILHSSSFCHSVRTATPDSFLNTECIELNPKINNGIYSPACFFITCYLYMCAVVCKTKESAHVKKSIQITNNRFPTNDFLLKLKHIQIKCGCFVFCRSNDFFVQRLH